MLHNVLFDGEVKFGSTLNLDFIVDIYDPRLFSYALGIILVQKACNYPCYISFSPSFLFARLSIRSTVW